MKNPLSTYAATGNRGINSVIGFRDSVILYKIYIIHTISYILFPGETYQLLQCFLKKKKKTSIKYIST